MNVRKTIKTMKKSLLSYSTIAILIVIFILLNGVGKSLFSRLSIDLTEDRLYSLSSGTEKIVKSLSAPITLKFYYSKTDSARFPAIRLYGERVKDLLQQYAKDSSNNIDLEIYDPRPDSEEQEWAQKYGLTAIPTGNGEELYLGLVAVNSSGDEDSIPAFDFSRQGFLEYDITKIISNLNVENKQVIGIISSLDLEGTSSQLPPQMRGRNQDEGPWVIATQLASRSTIKYIKSDATSIDSDVQMLFVIHPKNLPEALLFEIDQFVLKGGKLLLLEDPYCSVDVPPQDPSNPYAGMMAEKSSSLNQLTSAWGVEMLDKKVVADLNRATKVDSGRGQPQTFIAWLSPQKEEFNHEDITTSALEGMILPWPGSLQLTPKEGVVQEPLIQSTEMSQLLSDNDFRFNGGDPDTMLRNFSSDNTKKTIAVRVSGKLKSAFPQGKPGDEKAEHLLESKDKSNVIVVADADFIANRFSVMKQNIFGQTLVSLLNDNLNFAQNAAENLLGSDDLISIRSRGQFTRNFTVVDKMEVDAQRRFQQEEQVLQSKLSSANQRLSELQAATKGKSEKQVFDKAVLEEIKGFREERKVAQKRLREVRKELREGIENLGNMLFLLNTFLIPAILIGIALLANSKKGKL